MKLPLFMSLLLVWTTVNAKTISENFDASTDGTDVKIISHSMNYHMATFIDGTTTSSPRLVDRNKNRIEFQKLGEIKWIGLVPIFEFNDIDSYTDIVRSSENPTTIPSSKLPSYWKNSQLKITAGNLSSIVNEGPSAFGLFLLNLSEIPQMVADSSTNGKINITEKVEQNLDFINKFKKLQDFADDANAFVTYLNLFVDTIDKISDAMDEAGVVDKPEFLTDSYEYLSYATTISENALNAIGSLNIDSKVKSDMEAILFNKIQDEFTAEQTKDNRFEAITLGADKTASKYLSSVLNEIPKKFTTPSEKEEVFYKVGNIVLQSMGKLLTIHQKNKLATLDKDSPTYKEDYKKIALSIVEARLAIGVAVVGTSLFRNDIKDSQKYAGKYLLALANDAFQVLGSHLVNVSETLASNAIDPAMSKFGAGAGLAKVAKGVQIGNTVANQLIPFLYDLGLGESSASVDIADGEISLFGELDTKIIIRNTDGDIVWSSTYNNNDPKIYADKGNTFTVELYAKQDDLFDNSERSPWDVHTELPPSEIHSSSINYGSDKSFLKLCMIKTWFSSYIDFYSNSGGKNLGTTLFSKVSKTGTNVSPTDWSCAVKNTFTSSQTTKYGLDDLEQDDLSHLKLKNHNKPLLSKVIQITDFNENLFISVNSYDDNDFFKTIQFVSNDDRLQYIGQSQVHFDNGGTIALDFNKTISSSSLSKIKIFDGYYQEPRLLSESEYELIVDGNSLIVKIKNPEKHHNYLVHLENDVVAEDGATISENIEIDLQYVDYLSLEVSNSLECKQTGVCQFKIGYTSNMAEKLFVLNYGHGDNEVNTLNTFSSSEDKQHQAFTKTYPRSDSFNVVFQVYDDPSDTTPYLLEEITVQVDDIVDPLPVTPTNLVAAPDDGLVTLNWSSNEVSHRVHYATDSFSSVSDSSNYGALSGYNSVDVISGTSSTVQNLTNGIKYYFVVTALKDGRESGASNEVEITPTGNPSNSQVAGAYKVFDDGRTDIQENISFSRKYGNLLFLGTDNGKIFALDPQTLEVKSKVVISTDKFQYIDAKVDFIYRHNNDLYVSLNVRPSAEAGYLSDMYMAVYRIENEKIQNLSRLFKLRSDPDNGFADGGPITGMYYKNNYLYVTAGGSLASYDLTQNVPTEVYFSWVYGGVSGLCGIDDSIYVYNASSGSSRKLSKYTINSGGYSYINSIESSRYTSELVCSNSLLLTNNGEIYDKELNLAADVERSGRWSIEDSTAYVVTYLYNRDEQTCSLSGKSIDLITQHENEILAPINNGISSDKNCLSSHLLGESLYYYNDYINHIDSSRHRLSSYRHDLNINKHYALNGYIQKTAKNSNYVYIGTSNKILKIKDDDSYSVVLDWNYVSSLLLKRGIASFDVNDDKLLLTTHNFDYDNNVFLFNLSSNGFLESVSPYVRKYIRGKYNSVKGLMHEGNIVLTGVHGRYDSEYLNIYDDLVENKYFDISMPSASAVASGGSVYTSSSYGTNRVYYNSEVGEWSSENKDFLRNFTPVYIGNNITTFRSGDNFITLDESSNEIPFTYGNHFPFKQDGELFTFYSNGGAEIKILESKCSPKNTVGSVINHQNSLWIESQKGLCYFSLGL